MAKLITHDNKYCQFITEDIGEYNALKRFLSYKQAGVEYTPAFRNGWNGIIYLIDAKGFFYSGLHSRVVKFCKDNDIEIELDDRRKPAIKAEPIDLYPKLKSMGIVPRDYQEEIVEKCSITTKGIVRACTSSGKSIACALLIAKINRPAIVYVIGLDLLQQFHDLFSSIFDEKIGFIGNGVCDVQRINIVSIWSAGAALKLNRKFIVNDSEDEETEKELSQIQNEQVVNMLKTTSLHIFDESHVITTDTIKRIYKAIQPEYVFGMSGTPFRNDNTDLLIHGILGEQIIDISATQLIKQGVIAKPVIKFLPVPKMRTEGDTYPAVYKEYIVENRTRNMMVVENTKKLIEKRYTPLVLFKQIKHGEILFEMMKDSGINCEMLHGNDSLERREEVKQMLTDKKIDCIVSSVIFDIGINLPILSALVLAGGGRSQIRGTQRIGRIVRKYPGKETVAVIDFVDQVKYLKKHSQIRYETYSAEDGFEVNWPKGIK